MPSCPVDISGLKIIFDLKAENNPSKENELTDIISVVTMFWINRHRSITISRPGRKK